ncbi:ATP-binding cassette domain-containing protein [Butyrivibrio sp. NC3005]|uniref:ATP-binding cassette domain-containing protein n=1 Tax=Butyrivibrio sp. NC3005 TaxID=1280685 RepID=UPI00041C4ED4|nr:ABC transporter ATP-binding protein [Butyrivibrio sp. NC3005]
MFGRIINDFIISIEHLPEKKITLFKWIFLRALNETLSPLMVPIIIRIMLDTYHNKENFIIASIIIFLVMMPVFVLSYYIYVYSDAWVIKTMYEYQENALEKICGVSPSILNEKYTKGDISYVINSGAWGMIQLWMKIFRIVGPLVGTVSLLIYSIDFFVTFLFILMCAIILDFLVAWFQTRVNFCLNEQLIAIQGKKDNELRFILSELEFLVMNDEIKKELEINDDIVQDYWKNIKITNVFDAGVYLVSDMISALLKTFIYKRVETENDNLSSGQISSINQMYSNVKGSAQKTRSQVITLPNLLVPVEKMNELIVNSENEVQNLIWDDNSCISVKHLWVDYNNKQVIKDVNIELKCNDKVAIIGSNGSGKSTLLKALMKNVNISKGEVLINQCNINNISNQVVKNIFSYLPANYLLFSNSVEKNINMNTPEKHSQQDVISILMKSSFDEKIAKEILDKSTNSLSGGQKQRVAFGRLISMNKSIYLLDEPTASLDLENAKKLMDYVFYNLDTYIFTTHRAKEIQYANRIIFIHSGKVVCDLARKDFLESKYYQVWLGQNDEEEYGNDF